VGPLGPGGPAGPRDRSTTLLSTSPFETTSDSGVGANVYAALAARDSISNRSVRNVVGGPCQVLHGDAGAKNLFDVFPFPSFTPPLRFIAQ